MTEFTNQYYDTAICLQINEWVVNFMKAMNMMQLQIVDIFYYCVCLLKETKILNLTNIVIISQIDF